MERHLLLFDVDGTLLRTHGSGMRAMRRATLELFGPRFSWDGIDPAGGLDPLLFGQAALASAFLVEPGHHEAFRDRYLAVLGEELERGGAGVRAMPGIPEVLALLRGRDDAVLGLLTGNYGEGAKLKLRAVGIDPDWFRVTVFGDEAPTRPALVGLALEKYARIFGEPIDPRRVIVIGDTPRDAECALRNGCRALGVATGNFSAAELRAAGAHAAVDDLADPSPLLDLLAGRGPSPT